MDVSTDFEIVKEEEMTVAENEEVSATNVDGEVDVVLDDVIYATAMLRLYCALKGIAGMKLNNEESDELICLITSQVPKTAAGVRFVTVGLSTLLACSNMIK